MNGGSSVVLPRMGLRPRTPLVGLPPHMLHQLFLTDCETRTVSCAGLFGLTFSTKYGILSVECKSTNEVFDMKRTILPLLLASALMLLPLHTAAAEHTYPVSEKPVGTTISCR